MRIFNCLALILIFGTGMGSFALAKGEKDSLLVNIELLRQERATILCGHQLEMPNAIDELNQKLLDLATALKENNEGIPSISIEIDKLEIVDGSDIHATICAVIVSSNPREETTNE